MRVSNGREASERQRRDSQEISCGEMNNRPTPRLTDTSSWKRLGCGVGRFKCDRQFIAEGSQSKLLQDREEQAADHPADAPSTLENNQIPWPRCS
jgi:hypothetical protein